MKCMIQSTTSREGVTTEAILRGQFIRVIAIMSELGLLTSLHLSVPSSNILSS